ncbi:MAG: nitrogenase molybdenum-iron protein subunit beta [Endomicrobium sp.]|jgi:nitrogenase molybdenum-iron protein beta chain|nr:nitrogenase molybdenum-iron protein subunit beta [Endomicrobium sp.]
MLELTPNEYKERKALRINPAKTCQPVGAMYAALGIYECMPHSHGSQGCCSYHRTFLTRHFKDPVMATTSSFTEGSSVFGGGSNLKTAVKNIFEIYKPRVIAVHTTCLSETIGDDIPTIIGQLENVPEGKYVIHTNTPSYVGSHITGYSNMVKSMVKYFSKNTGVSNGKICVIPGFVNPGDMREIKRILKQMGVPFIMFPDTSGVLDSPMTGKFEMYPKGGATVEEMQDAGNSSCVLGLGETAVSAAARLLGKQCKIKEHILGLPIGIEATDDFILKLTEITGKPVPEEIEEERGQLVDIMIDAHPYYDKKTAAIYGDPDTVLGLAEFCFSLGMIPKFLITGTPDPSFEIKGKELFDKFGAKDGFVKHSADLFELHQRLKSDKVDLLIGGTHGKQIARAENIPFLRMGFPILDRYVHPYMPMVGYRGAMRILELLLNVLMDKREADAADEDFELVM